jgi:LuxR family maltose regulon positive regulatory protein
LNAFPYAPATLDPVGMAWQQSRVIMTEPLTRRETEVLVLLSQNLSYKEIAAQLVITLNTVKKHASPVYAKLGVNNRADALKKAMLLQVL